MRLVQNKQLQASYYQRILDSGFQVILYRLPGVYNKAAYLRVGFGGLHQDILDASGNWRTVPAGTAHYLEHILFGNSSDNPLAELNRIGAQVNASTEELNTSFSLEAPEDFWKALGLWLQLPLADIDSVERVEQERLVITRELEMYMDLPDQRSYRRALEILYPSHPLRWDVAGSFESIQAIDLSLLRSAQQSAYRPSNMQLLVIGDFKPTDMDRILEVLPNRYAQPGPKFSSRIPRDKARPQADHSCERSGIPLPVFEYILKLEPMDEPLVAAQADIATQLLLELYFGKGSAFFEAQYQQGWLDDLETGVYSGLGCRYVSFSGTGAEPEVFRKELDLALQQLEPVDLKAWERLKRRCLGRHLMGYQSISTIANHFISAWDRQINLFDYSQLLRQLKPDQQLALDPTYAVFSWIE